MDERQHTSFGSIRRRRRGHAMIAVATSLLVPSLTRGQSNFDIIGLTQLQALDPTLDGFGVNVAMVEDDEGIANTFEADPTATTPYVGQPASGFITYIDNVGNVSTTFSPSEYSRHATDVAGIFFGSNGYGITPGVNQVYNYHSNYFTGVVVPDLLPIPAVVVNQSFGDGIGEQLYDSQYDNYIDAFGTVIVIGVGNFVGQPVLSPASSYNDIAVGVSDNGPVNSEGTVDGRDKPDIVAPGGNQTSFSAPLVSGAAAILYQAGSRGDGGANPTDESEAVDPRTIKALLLTGASKNGAYNVWFAGNPASPLDQFNGAGMMNIYNSYLLLTAGTQTACSVSTTTSVGAVHAPATTGAPYSTLDGWNFSTLTTSASSDAYANYLFQPPAGTSAYTLAATLDWERQYNPNPAVPLGINHLDLYLYDTTADRLVDWSSSALDNVQTIYDTNLIPGDLYDLEVLKQGGSSVITNTETYALAFTNTTTSSASAAQAVWNSATGGSWLAASNWYNGTIPNFSGSGPNFTTANFTDAITSPSTITLDGYTVIQDINFLSTNSYTINPGANGGYLSLNTGNYEPACITVSAGNHYITSQMVLVSALDVVVSNSSDSLALSGNLSGNGSVTLSGNGTLTLTGTNRYTGGTYIDGGTLVATSTSALPSGGAIVNNSNLVVLGGTSSSPVLTGNISENVYLPNTGALTIGSPGGGTPAYLYLENNTRMSTISSLKLNSGSTLDISNNALLIQFDYTTDPIPSILAALTAGYNGGAWTGLPGAAGAIVSSTAAANVAADASPRLSIGYGDGNIDSGNGYAGSTPATPGQFLLMMTLAGDVNLDGNVDFNDLFIVGRTLNTTGNDWSQGNFTYATNGLVDFSDIFMLGQNLNQTLGSLGGAMQPTPLQSVPLIDATTSAVPEPMTFAILIPAGFALLNRRRRKIPPAS